MRIKMKKTLSLGLLLGLGMTMLAGCGKSLTADQSTVYVDKKGNVTSIDVEELDQGYYDETELEAYIKDAVNAYTEANGRNTVKVKSLEVDGTTARLTMSYSSTQDYSDFNGIELYQGKVVDSLAAGYTYDAQFVKVEEGKVVGKATKQEIYGEDGLKVVIIRANTDVQIEGEICYVSAQNVKLTGTDSVSIRKGYFLDDGTAEATESVAAGTEEAVPEGGSTEEALSSEIDGTEKAAVTDTETSDGEAADADATPFETDVYTFIVYR
jgi:hypothetical protein